MILSPDDMTTVLRKSADCVEKPDELPEDEWVSISDTVDLNLWLGPAQVGDHASALYATVYPVVNGQTQTYEDKTILELMLCSDGYMENNSVPVPA